MQAIIEKTKTMVVDRKVKYTIPKLSKEQCDHVCKVAHAHPEIVTYEKEGGSVTHIATLRIFVKGLATLVDDRIFLEAREALILSGEIHSASAWGAQLFRVYPDLVTKFDALFGEGMYSILDDHSRAYFHSFFGAALIELKRERMKTLMAEMFEARKRADKEHKRQVAEENRRVMRLVQSVSQDHMVSYWMSQIRDRNDLAQVVERIEKADKNTEVVLRNLILERPGEDFSEIFTTLNDRRSALGTGAFDIRFNRFVIAVIRMLRVKRIGAKYIYKTSGSSSFTKRYLEDVSGTRHELPFMAGF